MYCRYMRILDMCTKEAADWQLQFTFQLTGTLPNIFQYVANPDAVSVTEISRCHTFHPGLYRQFVKLYEKQK